MSPWMSRDRAGQEPKRRGVNVLCLLSWPLLTVSAQWAPLDWVLTGLVVVLFAVGVVWVSVLWWGQSVAVWFENVKFPKVGRRFRR